MKVVRCKVKTIKSHIDFKYIISNENSFRHAVNYLDTIATTCNVM